MPLNEEFDRREIPFLVPDLPQTDALIPYLKVIDENRWYSNFGPIVQRLEQGLTKRFFPELNTQDERLVTCSSGTAALVLAISGLDLPKGSKILVPSFTFAATISAIQSAGHEPVLADVDENSWQLTTELAVDAIEQTQIHAVITVAALGMPVDVDSWEAFVRDTNIPVVVDAAAALGDQVISQSLTYCFSMHATKAFGIGEGGFVIARCLDEASKLRRLSNFGFQGGIVVESGGNFKLSEYHAAIGLAQLDRWDELVLRREKVRRFYQKHLMRFLPFCDVQTKAVARYERHQQVVEFSPYGFRSAVALKLKDQFSIDIESVMDTLSRSGIGVRRWYYPVSHKHPIYHQVEKVGKHCEPVLPVSESLNQSLLGLPFHNFLTEPEIQYVCDTFLAQMSDSAPSKNRTY